jgi:hypothetical protein
MRIRGGFLVFLIWVVGEKSMERGCCRGEVVEDLRLWGRRIFFWLEAHGV